jgi:hypothetical protein
MKRIELQSFTLKLSELKEYQDAKAERKSESPQMLSSSPPNSSSIEKIIRGAKSKQEIEKRIGLNSDNQ